MGDQSPQILKGLLERLRRTYRRLDGSAASPFNPDGPEAAAAIDALLAAVTLAVPILEAEREVMVSSHMNRSGPDKGKVTDPEAAEIIGEIDAALTAARTALLPQSFERGGNDG